MRAVWPGSLTTLEVILVYEQSRREAHGLFYVAWASTIVMSPQASNDEAHASFYLGAPCESRDLNRAISYALCDLAAKIGGAP